MKKTIYLISFALLGLSAISCRKETITTEIDLSREPILFCAKTPETKGQPPLTKELNGLAAQDFSVSIWYSKKGDDYYTAAVPYVMNHRFGTTEEPQAITENTTWMGISRDAEGNISHDPVYYPLDGSLSFFCYAPFRDPEEHQDILIVNNPPEAIKSLPNYLPGSPSILFTPEMEISNQIDFIASVPVLNWEKGMGEIPLNFPEHLTSRIQFYCDFSGIKNEEEKIYISSIEIQNVVGSEYLYFTKDEDGALGFEWSKNVSPVEGSPEMPKVSYVLSTTNGALSSEDYLLLHEGEPQDINNYKYVNGKANGWMYVLPQEFIEGDPRLVITYDIVNGSKIVETNNLTYNLMGTAAWPLGQTLRYYITVNIADREDLTVHTVCINDWEDAGNTQGGSEELLY